jgi:hypothetical protein
MQELIDYLRGCPEGFKRSYGLCFNIVKFNEANLHKRAVESMHRVVCNWEHYSGNRVYPIAGEKQYTGSAMDAFNNASDMYTGEYGRRRIELANLIADELEKQLCKS